MKNKTILIIVLVCLGVFIVFGAVGSALFTTFFRNTDINNVNYDRNIQFMGKGEGFDLTESKSYDLSGVDIIDIYVVSSDIDIIESSGQLEVTLRSKGVTKGKAVTLVTEKSGSTLYIEVEYPKVPINITQSSLKVELPESYTGDVFIQGVSADVKGNLNNDLKELYIQSVSGDVDLSLTSIEDLEFKSTSGDFDVDSDVISSFSAETTSGRIDLESIINSDAEVYVRSVSGNIILGYENACETEVKTTSGDVDITLKNDEPVSLIFKSTSGDMNGDVIISRDGTAFDISTVSGDLSFD